MKAWVMMGVALTAAPAIAEECSQGTSSVLKLSSWSAEQAENGGTRISIRYDNTSGKEIEMVDATVWFRDALGDSIGGIAIGRDPHLPAGQSLDESSQMIGMERLTKIKPDNVLAQICTKSVLYADGTKASFESSGAKNLQPDEVDVLLGKKP